jgi:GNAT superfamily N-acetyltransferase
MTDITISPATPDDIPGMTQLLAEMDQFYGSPPAESEHVRERQLSEALFSQNPAGHALLARDGKHLAGFAAYSFLWPAVGLTRSLYLKELYVAEANRRQGIGKLLIEALYRVAAEHQCSRVEWTTDNDNEGAMAFYTTLGVPVEKSKVFYRVQNTSTEFALSD